MPTAERPALDLTRHAWVRELGEFRLYGTWFEHEQQDNEDTSEPCLVLVPAFRRTPKPCVILLQQAYMWTDPRYAAKMSLEFAITLGFESNAMQTANKIHGFIYDHLLDLIKMPENPTETQVGAYANVKFGDGPSRSVELLDHVPIPQA